MPTDKVALFKLIGLIGIGFLVICLFHVFIFSKAPVFQVHIPIHSGYNYGEVIIVSCIVALSTFLAVLKTNNFPIITASIIWLGNFFLISALGYSGWPTMVSRSIKYGTGAVFLFLIFSVICLRHGKGRPHLILSRIFGLTSFIALFFGFVVTSRLVQLVSINSLLPFDKSYISTWSNSSGLKRSCQPDKGTLYSSSKSNDLIVILDGYPVKSHFKAITGKESGLHTFLLNQSSFYSEGSTNIPFTANSVAFLLAGIKPNSNCTYPIIGGSRSPRIAFSSAYFQLPGSLCNSNNRSLISGLNYAFKKLLHFFNSRLFSNPVEDVRLRKASCSLINAQMVPSLVTWANAGLSNDQNLNIIHDLFFHDYNKDYSRYGQVDKAYEKALRMLIDSLRDGHLNYDRIIVISDHGPRTELYGKLVPGDVIVRSSKKFDDYYSTFVAVFTADGSVTTDNPVRQEFNVFYQADNLNHPKQVKVIN